MAKKEKYLERLKKYAREDQDSVEDEDSFGKAFSETHDLDDDDGENDSSMADDDHGVHPFRRHPNSKLRPPSEGVEIVKVELFFVVSFPRTVAPKYRRKGDMLLESLPRMLCRDQPGCLARDSAPGSIELQSSGPSAACVCEESLFAELDCDDHVGEQSTR